jgi:hypothetical protein
MSSISNFDLNIGNYSKSELEEILELPTNYDESTIQMKETKLRQNIMNDISIPVSIKTQTLQFISNIKNALTVNIQKNNSSGIFGTKMESLAKSFNNIYNTNKELTKSDVINSGGTFIIKQPVTPYGQSSPSEFYAGSINPLNKRTLRQNINIDTRFRENYYSTQSSNFHLDLPIRLTQVVSLQLSALEIPSTFYAISKVFGNNFFVISLPNAVPAVEPLIVTLPDGNYTYLTLQKYINNFLSTNPSVPAEYTTIQFLSDVNTPDGNGNGGSGRMVVGSLGGDIEFSLNFQTDKLGNEDRQTPLPLKLGWIMGFREGYYENNTTYVSEGLIDVLGPRYIYLVVDDFNNNVSDGFYGAFTSSILNKNILARITLQGSVFNIITQNNLVLITTARQYFGPVDIQKLQIQLLDEYGRILDLNNMDYSFCLSFQTIYDL